tara:strand:+ start:68 stop:394 length:327 start_codon:yes stop_codon:yes gene_type:complete
MYFFDESELTEINRAEGVVLKTLWGEKIMMSLVELSAGAIVPEHVHENEQAGLVLEGEFEFIIGNESKVISKGEYYMIPGNIPHKVITGTKPARALDIFSPPREDYKR